MDRPNITLRVNSMASTLEAEAKQLEESAARLRRRASIYVSC